MSFADTISTLKKHFPQIALGSSIVLRTAAVIDAVYVTPKALEALDVKKEELGLEKLSFWQKVKTASKYYIPAALMIGCSIGLDISEQVYYERSINDLTAVAAGIAGMHHEYKEHVEKSLNKTQKDEIQKSIAEDKVKKAMDEQHDEIINLRKNMDIYEESLCIDALTGKAFVNSISELRDGIHDINIKKHYLSEEVIDPNYVRHRLNMPEMTEKYNDLHGYLIDDNNMWLDFTTTLYKDKIPVVMVEIKPEPKFWDGTRWR